LHRWDVGKFHTNCDGKDDTVTIIKSGDYLFGGFTDIPWGKLKKVYYLTKQLRRRLFLE